MVFSNSLSSWWMSKILVIFWHYRVEVFHVTLWPSSRVLVIINLAKMLPSFFSVSPRTTNIRLEVSLPREWLEWNLSKNQTKLLTHRYSKNHRYNALVETSKFVWVVLETSIYFSVIVLSAIKVWLLVHRDGGIWSSSWHEPKIVYRFTGIWKRVLRLWKRLFWFSKKVNITLSLNWSMPYQGGWSQVLISSKSFDSSICDW